MRAPEKPRCFVAMAFDQDDTDALYGGAIHPVLKANGIIPVIINRREDNRDINHQIIEQLDACDFCITDLTYTRPSVYFEAGYAQRAVEVIYTVRSDHLLKNQPDDMRVHFDLQMKPLIKWINPEDKTFPGRLERRIRSTVLRTWRNRQKAINAAREDRDEFARMPLAERLSKLQRGAETTISHLGFDKWDSLTGLLYSENSWMRPGHIPSGLRSPFYWGMSHSRQDRLLRVVSLRVEESLGLKQLRDEFQPKFISSPHPPHLRGSKMVDEPKPINRTIEHHLLVSIRLVPQARIMSAIPSLRWDSANSRYSAKTKWRYGSQRLKTKGEKEVWVDVLVAGVRMIYVYFIDGIQSIPEFQSRLSSVAEQIKGNQPRAARRHG